MTRACKNCARYEALTEDDNMFCGSGECRRYAPKPITGPGYEAEPSTLPEGAPIEDLAFAASRERYHDRESRRGHWPVVDAEDWCGEFVDKAHVL